MRSECPTQTNLCSVYSAAVYTSPFVRVDGTERAWTEHLATTLGARALLEAGATCACP